MNKKIIIPIIVILIIVAGIGVYFIFQKFVPERDKCGDGICDEKENPRLCPKDCGQQTTSVNENSPFGIHPAVPIEEAKNIGIKWSRGGNAPYIFWFLVDPQMSGDPKQFQWKGIATDGKRVSFDYDKSIGDPNKAGLEVLWNIDIQPEGVKYHKSYSWLPADETAYRNFVKEAAKRYPFVRYWQIGNEPMAQDKLSDYGKFLLITYEAIKESNPQAKVLIGGTDGLGMPQTIEEYKTNFEKVYLPLLQDIARLDKRSFDIFDFHWYGDATDDYRRTKEIYSYISQKISELGIPAPEEYWITEMGTYSGDPKIPSTTGRIKKTDWPYQSEKQHAIDIVKRYVYPLSFGIKKIFLAWGLKEGFRYDEGYFDFTGLIYDGKFANDLGDGVRKLSYYAYKKMVETLEGSDWENIQTIQESDGIYIYKFTKNNKPIWVAWNDNKESRRIKITLEEDTKDVKITEAVPKYESGKEVKDYSNAFGELKGNILESYPMQLDFEIGEKPVFVEEQ